MESSMRWRTVRGSPLTTCGPKLARMRRIAGAMELGGACVRTVTVPHGVSDAATRAVSPGAAFCDGSPPMTRTVMLELPARNGPGEAKLANETPGVESICEIRRSRAARACSGFHASGMAKVKVTASWLVKPRLM